MRHVESLIFLDINHAYVLLLKALLDPVLTSDGTDTDLISIAIQICVCVCVCHEMSHRNNSETVQGRRVEIILYYRKFHGLSNGTTFNPLILPQTPKKGKLRLTSNARILCWV